jgi:hypothetical protein
MAMIDGKMNKLSVSGERFRFTTNGTHPILCLKHPVILLWSDFVFSPKVGLSASPNTFVSLLVALNCSSPKQQQLVI